MTSPHNPFQQSPPPPPATGRLSPLLLLPLVIVLALGGVLIWQKDAIFRGGDGGAAPSAETSPGAATSWVTDTVTADSPPPEAGGAAEPPTAARIVANTTEARSGGSGLENISTVGLQKWIDDVNNNDVAAVTRKCWTFSPEYIQERYFDNRDRIAAVMTNPPGGTQSGVVWYHSIQGGDQVYITMDELRSSYPCPSVQLEGQAEFPDSQIIHNIKRLILRDRGTPISPYDTDEDYPMLICTSPAKMVNNDIHNLDQADPENIIVTGHPSDRDWTAESNGVEFTVKNHMKYICIDTAD
ncbi:hypothetical protein [Corynebacterium variabile]|uniref:hypothetical protein n=1 Tax=Corynebacterium variabile TaxID=1727 RepID=UPI003A941248